MNIYQLVFGIDQGQVCCAFHDDTSASAGIGPEGQYNCLVPSCAVKAHDEVGFIAKYFNVGIKYAAVLKSKLESVDKYPYTQNPLSDEQVKYLLGIGIVDSVIKANFFRDGKGLLRYHHKWSGVTVGTTWFNNPSLPEWNASAPKYKYGPGLTGGGMLTPYDSVIQYDTLVICEGEKDMLTARSMGIPNAVAKLGGAGTPVLAGVNLRNKKVALVYDCDEAGRQGAIKDATTLTDDYKCVVKVIDLGLSDKEDLNDYFIKHQKKTSDFNALLKSTPVFVPDPTVTMHSKLERFVSKLSPDELEELKLILNQGKGN
jgi:hypothetical protein